VEAPKVAEGVPDGVPCWHGVRSRREDVPPAAGLLPGPQVVVPAAEQRRPERRDQRERVAGIIGRPGGGEQVADLAGPVDQGAGFGPVADAGRVEGVLQVRQRRAGRYEHGDVAQPYVPPTVPVCDLPSLQKGGAHVGGLPGAQVVCGRLVSVRTRAEQCDRMPVGRGLPDRQERVVCRLGARFGGDELAEYVVDPGEYRLGGAEIGLQAELAADPLLRLEEMAMSARRNR